MTRAVQCGGAAAAEMRCRTATRIGESGIAAGMMGRLTRLRLKLHALGLDVGGAGRGPEGSDGECLNDQVEHVVQRHKEPVRPQR